MTMTTIKVSRSTRDRLKAQAAQKHRTLGEHLDALADTAERDARFRLLREAIAQTSAEDLSSWKAEAASWESASLADLDEAAD